jgi:hypothetical protein
MNYIEYILGGEQVGPLGKSSHTDRAPIRVPFDGCVSEAEALDRDKGHLRTAMSAP